MQPPRRRPTRTPDTDHPRPPLPTYSAASLPSQTVCQTATDPDHQTALEQCFSIEEAYAADLGDLHHGDPKQGAFNYHMLCMGMAERSASRLIAEHRSRRDPQPEPFPTYFERVLAAKEGNPDYRPDPSAVGLEPHRAEIDDLIRELKARLTGPAPSEPADADPSSTPSSA